MASKHSIEILQIGSCYIERQCPVTRTKLAIGEQVVICHPGDEVFSWNALPTLKGRCPYCRQMVPVGEILGSTEETDEKVIPPEKRQKEKSKSEPQYSLPKRHKELPFFWTLLGMVLILLIGIGIIIGYPYVSPQPNAIPTSTLLATYTVESTPDPPTSTPTPNPTVTPMPSPTMKPTSTSTPHIGATMISPKDKMVSLYVPAGEFRMGSHYEEIQGYRLESEFRNELPSHQVYLDAFWIDRTEVTNGQYNQCVKSGVCLPSGCLDRQAFNQSFV